MSSDAQPRPSVTVLMPVRNGAATVSRALESVLAQTWTDWELVAVEDGSSDGTRALLEQWARREPRVRILVQPPLGIVAALDAGLAASRGHLVARLDADDEMLPERLAAQGEAFERDPGLGLVSCLVRYGGDRSAGAGYALHVDWLNSLVSPAEIALNRFIESPFAHPSVMFRRELAARHGGYRGGDFPEDYELWLRWMEAGVRVAKVPAELVVWHDPPGRLSRTDPRYSDAAFFRMKAPYVARAVAGLLGGRALWIWGAGRLTRRRAEMLAPHGLRPSGYIDIDPNKIGRRAADGLPVVAPGGVPSPDSCFVLGYVASRGARPLVRRELGSRGFVEGRDFLMGA